MIVDQARYSAGRRLPCTDIGATLHEIRSEASEDYLWIGMRDPSAETFDEVSEQLGLHPLAIEDSVKGDQRLKIERYGDGHFVVLRPLRYVEATSDVESGEIMVFIGADHIVTIRKGEASPLAGLRSRLEADGHDALRHGPWGVFHAIIDFVVDQYLEIEDEIQQDLDDIEAGVFSPDGSVSTAEIYALKREVLEFKRAALPLARPLALLVGTGTPVPTEELRLRFRDVNDHLSLVNDNTESQDRLLSDVLSAHLAQVGVQQLAHIVGVLDRQRLVQPELPAEGRKVFRRRRPGLSRQHLGRVARRQMKHEEVDSEDWFTDWQVVNYLVDKEENINGQITEDYCKTLEKIELAILAKKNVLLREEE